MEGNRWDCFGLGSLRRRVVAESDIITSGGRDGIITLGDTQSQIFRQNEYLHTMISVFRSVSQQGSLDKIRWIYFRNVIFGWFHILHAMPLREKSNKCKFIQISWNYKVIANLGWVKLILFDYEGNLDRIKISNHETQKSIEACIDHLHGARRRQKESVSA